MYLQLSACIFVFSLLLPFYVLQDPNLGNGATMGSRVAQLLIQSQIPHRHEPNLDNVPLRLLHDSRLGQIK